MGILSFFSTRTPPTRQKLNIEVELQRLDRERRRVLDEHLIEGKIVSSRTVGKAMQDAVKKDFENVQKRMKRAKITRDDLDRRAQVRYDALMDWFGKEARFPFAPRK